MRPRCAAFRRECAGASRPSMRRCAFPACRNACPKRSRKFAHSRRTAEPPRASWGPGGGAFHGRCNGWPRASRPRGCYAPPHERHPRFSWRSPLGSRARGVQRQRGAERRARREPARDGKWGRSGLQRVVPRGLRELPPGTGLVRARGRAQLLSGEHLRRRGAAERSFAPHASRRRSLLVGGVTRARSALGRRRCVRGVRLRRSRCAPRVGVRVAVDRERGPGGGVAARAVRES